jgi:parallel beta-helix repeat protein
MIGVAGSLQGVVVSGTRANVAVHNGTVRSWGGIGIDANSAKNAHFENLRLSGNGSDGLRSGASSLVRACTSNENGGNGLVASDGSEVLNCVANANGADGIQGSLGCTIQACTARGNKTDGIEVVAGCVVRENNSDTNGNPGDGAAINLISGGNRIERNNVLSSDRGIDANPAIGNIIVGNTAKGNGTNYDIVAGNSAGEILNVGGATIVTDKPWVNFGY